MEHALELGQPTEAGEDVRKAIALYNADDCFSTRSLRDWLERERQALELAGHRIARPPTSDGAPPENVDERQRKSCGFGGEANERRFGSIQRNEARRMPRAGCWRTFLTGIGGNPRRIGGNISV